MNSVDEIIGKSGTGKDIILSEILYVCFSLNFTGDIPTHFLKLSLKYAGELYPRDSLISLTERNPFKSSSFADSIRIPLR